MEATRASRQPHPGLLLVLSYVGFVSLGLPDTILGAAWPALRAELGLQLPAAGPLLLGTTAGVVVSSLASAAFRRRWGSGALLCASTVLAALALATSALARGYEHLLLAAIVAGLGGGAIDACLNDYVARHHSARHMNWLHACWGVGASLGPAVVSSVLARHGSWRSAYALLAAVEALLVLSFWFTRAQWSEDRPPLAANSGSARPLAERRAVWASVLLFFCYCGLEAGAGLWASSLLTETRGASPAFAGAAVAVYWGALCVGRFVIGSRADHWGPARVLRLSVAQALLAVGVLTLQGTPAWFVTVMLAWLGVSLAAIYPLAMHDTPRLFGQELGARVVSYQVAAGSVGIASVPWLLGWIAARTSLGVLPSLLVILAASVVVAERIRSRAHLGEAQS